MGEFNDCTALVFGLAPEALKDKNVGGAMSASTHSPRGGRGARRERSVDTEPPKEPAEMHWPQMSTRGDGRVIFSFEAPGSGDNAVDWLRVRDWLTSTLGARFLKAMEYPTFEWSSHFVIQHNGLDIPLCLFWCDFPHDLWLQATTAEGDTVVRAIASRLASERPDFGSLSTMSRRAWADWMISLGSCDYRRKEPPTKQE